MAVTLDEYLAEVDRWKQAAQDELDALSPEARAERLAKVRAEFETARGRPLDKPQSVVRPESVHNR
jgi:hypothetical protein